MVYPVKLMSSSKSNSLIEGVLLKKELMNTVWKERYFILSETGVLSYYDNHNDAVHGHNKNDINLRDVKSFKKTPDAVCTLELITNSNKKYIVSSQELNVFMKWSKYIEEYVYGDIIHRGFMFKLGEKHKSWKKRWFILYDTKKLMYHENDNELLIPKGIIYLHNIIGYGYGSESQYNAQFVMELKTPTRVWALKCLNEAHLTKWFECIISAMNIDKRKKNDDKNIDINTITRSKHRQIDKRISNELFTASMPHAVSIDFNLSYNSYQSYSKLDSIQIYSKLKLIDANILSDEYRKIQKELNDEYTDIMKDVVINKHHTLAMDASTNYCYGNKEPLISAQSPRSPRSPSKQFIALIPKKNTNDMNDIKDDVPDVDPDIDIECPENDLFDNDLELIMSPVTQRRIDREYKEEIFEGCGCVERLILILKIYTKWMEFKKRSELNDNEGFCGILAHISDKYSLCDVLNDYYHIKRFHVEYTNKLDPAITSYICKNLVSKCEVNECVSFKRNITRDGTYYIVSGNNTMEVVTQQILDIIHCYLLHLSHCIRNNVCGESNHKFVTLVEENEDDGTEHDDKTLIKAKYGSMRAEVLNCDHCILRQEWMEINLKSQLFLGGFESLWIKCKKRYDLVKKNEFLSTEFVCALMLYSNHHLLRNEVMSSSSKFYHLWHILENIINAFGGKVYESSCNVYHCFSSPVLFNNLCCEFKGGAVSMTSLPSIVLTKMYIDKFKNGIIVEMDVNNSGSSNCFDISIYSNFPYELERIFYGNIRFSISNIIQSDIAATGAAGSVHKFCYHSNYLDAISLLRMIIGHLSFDNLKHYDNGIICDRLSLLISLEINYRRMIASGKSINKQLQLVPEYIGALFHSWCLNVKGVIVLKLGDIVKLSQTRLQSYFLSKNGNNISLNYKILFQIFPFITKILCYGFQFDDYLCRTFMEFVSSQYYQMQLKHECEINECILQFEQGIPKEYEQIITKYETKYKTSGWQINLQIPQQHDLDYPKISFRQTQ